MKKKFTISAILFLMAFFTAYFFLFHKDKKLHYIPENADIVVLLDVKNIARNYMFQYLQHPSLWFKKSSDDDSSKIKWNDCGIIIPDFVQVFHLENSDYSQWYTVFEIKDSLQFSKYLKQEEFIPSGNGFFQKNEVSVKILHGKCMVATGKTQDNLLNTLLQTMINTKKFDDADKYLRNSQGSISFIAKNRISNFSVNLNDNSIVIQNNKNTDDFKTLINQINKSKNFLNLEMDKDNIRKIKPLSKNLFSDSLKYEKIRAVADLEMKTDTIIAYEYDENFNEIQKISFQKILQPSYFISLESENLDDIWNIFQNKKWINAKTEFTQIPFFPNQISKNKTNISIFSTQKNLVLEKPISENYIFCRNNQNFINSIRSLSANEKKIFSDVDYLFYGNKKQEDYFEIAFKKAELPIILRY